MEKTVKFVKNSLKFKAKPKSNIISVKVGSRKFTVPVDARLISHDEYLFLSFSSISELFKVDGSGLVAMEPDADATAAYTALSPATRKKRSRRKSGTELPESLKEALGKLPPGTKLVSDTRGGYRLAKRRKRG